VSGPPCKLPTWLEDDLIQLTDGVRRLLVDSGVVAWAGRPRSGSTAKTIGALAIGDRAGRPLLPRGGDAAPDLRGPGPRLRPAAGPALRGIGTAPADRRGPLAEVGRLISETLDPRLVGNAHRRQCTKPCWPHGPRSCTRSTRRPGASHRPTPSSTEMGTVFDWTPRLEPGVGITGASRWTSDVR